MPTASAANHVSCKTGLLEPSPKAKPVTVLLVEHAELDRQFSERLLRKLNHETELHFAIDAAKALAKIATLEFDCIIVACGLPDMRGEDLVAEISSRLPRRTAVVVLTDVVSEDLAASVLKAGADDYLPKSELNLESFGKLINGALERSRLIRKLANQDKRLEQARIQLEQFTKAASHDLQEPLRTIVSFTELLQSRCEDDLDAKSKSYLAFIHEGAARMRRMVKCLNEMADLSVSDTTFVACDMDELVSGVIADLHAVIEESGARVSVAPLPQATVNRAQIRVVWQNLICNAIKYNDKAHPLIEIDAKPVAIGELDHFASDVTLAGPVVWQFRVTDNGIGIDPEFSERIFFLFQRLHRPEDYAGTGFGLAQCKKVIEIHKGRIWVERAPQEGARFVFTLPQTAESL